MTEQKNTKVAYAIGRWTKMRWIGVFSPTPLGREYLSGLEPLTKEDVKCLSRKT